MPRLRLIGAFAVIVLGLARLALACPCKEGDVGYSDEEGAACKSNLETIAFLKAHHPEALLQEDAFLGLRLCVTNARRSLAVRAQHAEAIRADAEVQARLKEERRKRDDEAIASARASMAERSRQEAEAAQRINAAQLNPKIMQPALSAALCFDASVRIRALSEIRKQQRYAKIGGGIIDRQAIYELQRTVREADEDASKSRAALKELKVPALTCKRQDVLRFYACFEDKGADGCTDQTSEIVGAIDVPTY